MNARKQTKKPAARARRGGPPPGRETTSGPAAAAPAGETKDDAARAAPRTFPVVAIGASAGGLEALRRFFQAMPTDRRIAFVVIVHLSPDHVSHFAELLRGSTKMRVTQIGDHDRVEPGHVYVIPPNRFVRVE